MDGKNAKKSDASAREEQVLKFWLERGIFSKTLDKKSPKGEFVFYEGPPTANGAPGIHHLEARSFKDAIPRYKTMRGYHVRRKGGWDTHGLPVELQVEKKLKLNSKKAIEAYGIAKFNHECKASVWEYLDVWNKFTKRIGFWVDQDDPYVTYHNEYIESVWNVVKEVDKQELLYKDYKVVPWCPRCGTALSSHELAQGYEDVKDLSVTAKFKIVAQAQTQKNSSALLHPTGGTFRGANSSASAFEYLLAWTTTPWTLPGNVALAVGKDIDYVKIKVGGEFLILAKERLSIITDKYKIVGEMKGKDLIGLEYEPLFPYFAETLSPDEKPKLEKAYKVYSADFVNTEDGTGIVHTAVMYGQDDFVLGDKVGLPKHHLVDLDGKFLPGTGFLERRFVKDEDVAVDIIKDLAHRGLLFTKEKYAHSYPHCWRCKTPLIYYARDSWYIRMSDPKIKKKLISENKEINWEPEHIRDGRFGEWLRDIKDWAISRERYWGTPLPVWVCDKCDQRHVIGSVAELKERTKVSGNKYFVMRHAGSTGNESDTVSYQNQASDHLTPEGTAQAKKAATHLKKKKIDLIITSPFARTKETADIVGSALGLPASSIIAEPLLEEINPGEFDGKNWSEYHEYMHNLGQKWFDHKISNGESYAEAKKRTARALYALEEKYKDKNILLVTHGAPAWLLFVNSGMYEPEDDQYHLVDTHAFVKEFPKYANAEVRDLPFVPTAHNEEYELDLHRPYIDEVPLVCGCGGGMDRTKEVMDVWFDSGAMPFAQDHYPFESKKWVEGAGYPADFISEAIDQTRGWFYTLHAIGVLMGRGKAYKNVICLGHLMDEKGKKMSKSIGNVVDPWEMIEKYGVDTLRLWMYSVNQPGESKNFDEKTVKLLSQQIFGLLYNVLAFYELYPAPTTVQKKADKHKPKHILDRWILARLDELIVLSTTNMDDYKLLEPVRAMREFINDLSTWYLRRSRDRLREGDPDAQATMYVVLRTLAKLIAPFAPFSAEDIWQRLKLESDEESVHLESWPVKSKGALSTSGAAKLLMAMRTTRGIVSLGLEARQRSEVKVRQPLAKIEVKELDLSKEYVELIKDELNVRDVVHNKKQDAAVVLDTNITEDLKEEGKYRELARAMQDMRKDTGLTPSDEVSVIIETSKHGEALIGKFESDLKKTVLLSSIEFKKNNGAKIKVAELVFTVKMVK